MAQQRKSKRPAKKRTQKKKPPPWRIAWRWFWRVVWAIPVVVLLWIAALSYFEPPKTFYMVKEEQRLGKTVKHVWVDIEDVAPVMARSVAAAEDANFCRHWGIDMGALRQAIEDGGNRGASTISQQVVKNVFLWHGRSYPRKALEALLTPVVEILWSKKRIMEVYLNVAEFDEGVFGVGAASRHYFGVSAGQLSPTQAARLAAILPSPKTRSAKNPGAFTRKKAQTVIDGAATIRADGRADCFAD